MLPGPSSVSRALGALGGLALAAAVVAPAGASFPGVNGEIVTRSFKDNRALAAVSEAGVRTELPIEGGYPGFSPDGATLVSHAVTTSAPPMPTAPTSACSPRRRRAARYRWPGFSRTRRRSASSRARARCRCMRADGTQLREIPKSGQAWQPRDRHRRAAGILLCAQGRQDAATHSAKANGRGLKRLTNSPTGFQDIEPDRSRPMASGSPSRGSSGRPTESLATRLGDRSGWRQRRTHLVADERRSRSRHDARLSHWTGRRSPSTFNEHRSGRALRPGWTMERST